jgi:hypothetical protein
MPVLQVSSYGVVNTAPRASPEAVSPGEPIAIFGSFQSARARWT